MVCIRIGLVIDYIIFKVVAWMFKCHSWLSNPLDHQRCNDGLTEVQLLSKRCLGFLCSSPLQITFNDNSLLSSSFYLQTGDLIQVVNAQLVSDEQDPCYRFAILVLQSRRPYNVRRTPNTAQLSIVQSHYHFARFPGEYQRPKMNKHRDHL